MNGPTDCPVPGRLYFKKGDLICQEGDYSISIYKVVRGAVRIFTRAGDLEMYETRLEPGGLFGEEAFLTQGAEPLKFSARALEDTELEVQSALKLTQEYHRLPSDVRFIFDQTVKRIQRTEKILARLRANQHAGQEPKDSPQAWAAQQRQYYRKTLNRTCVYRPVDATAEVVLTGRIKDLSQRGLGLEVSEQNIQRYRHERGDKFIFELSLTAKNKIRFIAGIENIRKVDRAAQYWIGLSIAEIGYESNKRLGFFLMP